MALHHINPLPESELVSLVRQGSPMAILRRHGVRLRDYWAEYPNHCSVCQAIPGLNDSLEDARSSGVKCGIVTSLPQAAASNLLKALGLKNYFSCVITYGSTTRHKPNADLVSAGVSALGLKPSECVYVGDQASDVQAGKAAGVSTVAVLWGFGPESEIRSAQPDRILSETRELLDLIEQGKHAIPAPYSF
jgi:HAD superfamily hydrolase (TIGR01509 family)